MKGACVKINLSARSGKGYVLLVKGHLPEIEARTLIAKEKGQLSKEKGRLLEVNIGTFVKN